MLRSMYANGKTDRTEYRVPISHVQQIHVQSNFSGSNTFGTMKISSRQGLFESMRVDYSARSGGLIGTSFFIFFNMKVCCVFSLESPHRGDSNEYTHYTIFNI